MSGRLAGAPPIPLALAAVPSQAHAALAQAWPPFVLVAGLLLVGLVAGRDGLFEAASWWLVRLPVSPLMLALACFALVALVTALLNLDTSAVFLTPVLVHVARRRGVQTAPFLYGAVFMANASSLFLPGSNLTNLLVLSGGHATGATFLARMLPMALAAPLLTAGGLVAIHRRALWVAGDAVAGPRERVRPGVGLWGALACAALIVALRDPALPVLAVGLVALAARLRGGRLTFRQALSSLGLPALIGLFGLAVALGTLARASSFPADALHGAGGPTTAVVAALASVAVNNLPAAVLLSSVHGLPVGALLLGCNVGPNLAVSGSLAVLLWWRAAVAVDARPSALAYSRQGVALAPLALAGALAVGLAVASPYA
jgi:arsenical pump membrane protein